MKRKRSRKTQDIEHVPPAEPPQPRGMATHWWAHLLVVLALLLGNLALYHGAFQLGFLSVDDADYVQNNPYIENFSRTNLTFIFTKPYGANYAPANLLSYSLDVAVAKGKSASAIHISNVLWHGWVACMVYMLAFVVRPRILPAAAAAALFLLHPAHVEVVAWISSRKDLVATAFAVLSMAAYLLYRRPGRRYGWWYAGSVGAFLLASAGKQSVLLLPAVMLAWDLFVERRWHWRIIADKVPYGLITLFFGWMTWHAQPSTNQSLNLFTLAATELTNLWLLSGLGTYVLYHPAPTPATWSMVARIGIIAGAVIVWLLPLLLVRARQAVRASLCYWVLVQMVPPMLLAFIVPVTERYLFLPSVGICLLLAGLTTPGQGGPEVCPPADARRPGWMTLLPWCLLAALAVVWGVKTYNYVEEWRDPRSVWYGAHLKTPSSQVQQFLGEVYQNTGDRITGFINSATPLQLTNEIPFAQAVLRDDAAVERLRSEWTGASTARTNSLAYRDQLWSFAWQRFEESLARRGTLSTPNLFMCRGRLLVSQGKFAQAIPEFQNALALAEHSSYDVTRSEGATHALFAIGVAYWNMGKYRDAEQWLLKAQTVQHKSGQAWVPNLDREVERVKRLAATSP